MNVIHYARDKNFKLQPIRIANSTDGIPIKPVGGLWASPLDSSDSWEQWCKAENFGDISSLTPVLLEIDTSNFITIDKRMDLKKLPWYRWHGILEGVDFEELVRRGVDGIYLTSRGQVETRWAQPGLYGWDCESILILNDKCIRNWKLVEI